MRLIHIFAGLSALVSGAVALYALKGARLHRRGGVLFVAAMLVMSATGAVLAALKVERISVVAGVLTFYLVITALLTVRRPAGAGRWADVAALPVVVAAGVAGFSFGVQAMNSPTGTLDGLPAFPGFLFAAVALLATIGDARLLLGRGLKGARRIARHLWRMCFALWIAAASFFLGQPQVFPRPLRESGLLVIPVLLALVLMLYWLVRVLFTKWYSRAYRSLGSEASSTR